AERLAGAATVERVRPGTAVLGGGHDRPHAEAGEHRPGHRSAKSAQHATASGATGCQASRQAVESITAHGPPYDESGRRATARLPARTLSAQAGDATSVRWARTDRGGIPSGIAV